MFDLKVMNSVLNELEEERGIPRAKVIEAISVEENKFRLTLEKGLKEFSKLADQGNISGDQAFILFSTYGFPLEITKELAAEKGLAVDENGFLTELAKHQELSKAGAEQKFKGGLAGTGEMETKYHTATHLLLASLRQILGADIVQKGSNITTERLRFDFSHPAKMTAEQISETEKLINAAISRDYPVSWQEMSVEEARAKQAIGLFAERYDGIV